MFYFPNLNAVYCPIERTASRSTESYLFAHDPSGYRLGPHRHSCSIGELDGLSPSKIYVSTRHPWDRFCSMFAADQLKVNAGFGVYWTTIDEYLDFQLAHKDKEFLVEGNYSSGEILSIRYRGIGNNRSSRSAICCVF